MRRSLRNVKELKSLFIRLLSGFLEVYGNDQNRYSGGIPLRHYYPIHNRGDAS